MGILVTCHWRGKIPTLIGLNQSTETFYLNGTSFDYIYRIESFWKFLAELLHYSFDQLIGQGHDILTLSSDGERVLT